MLMRPSVFAAVLKSCAILSFAGGLWIAAPSLAETERDYLLNEQGELTADDEQLDSGHYLDAYAVDTVPDQNLVILLGSDDFDSYLYVFDEEWNKLAENDNYQDTHSGLILDNPNGGKINIVPSSHDPNQLGVYYLTVRDASDVETAYLDAEKLSTEALALYEEGSESSLRQAEEKWLTALELFQQVKNVAWQASTLNKLGLVSDLLGEKDVALERYEASLALHQEAENPPGEAAALNNIGHLYSSTGDKQKALEFYTTALTLMREIGDRQWEGTALNNIGAVHHALGELEIALEYYEESLPILREVGNRSGEARTLSSVGAIYDVLGDRQKALDHHALALAIYSEINDRNGEATALNNLGTVYDDLGEEDLALEYYEASVVLSREAGERLGEARTLGNIGGIYRNRGEYEKAVEYLLEALPLLQAIGDRFGEATTLSDIGLIFLDVGRPERALEYYEQALPITQDTGNRPGEASVLNRLGRLYAEQDELAKAIDYFQESLTLSQAMGDRPGQALQFYNIAYFERQQNNTEIAVTAIESAIEIVEDLRVKVASPELRQSYFATVQFYYELYIELLMEQEAKNPNQGYAQKAFLASEQSRARTLLDLLTEANADIREGVDPDLLAQEKELLATLDLVEKARVSILNDPKSTSTEKKEADENLAITTSIYKDLQTEIRLASPKYANLKYPEPLSVEELQQNILDDDTVLFQYSLHRNKSYLWAISKDDFVSYELANLGTLQTAIEQVRQNITSIRLNLPPHLERVRTQQRLNAIQTLSELVLAPALDELDKKRLVIVADEDLHFIPFSVLSLSGQEYNPLGDRHEIVNVPSVSALESLRVNENTPIQSDASLAMIADPVFNNQDCRLDGGAPICDNPTSDPDPTFASGQTLDSLALKRSAKGFDDVNWDRLLGTRTEAQSILNLLAQQSGDTLQAFDFDANRDLMTGDRLEDYDLIHIATHGFLNTVEPELSGIVFSLVDQNENPQNGFLRLNDVFNLKLNASLVVLSACQTGLGDQVKGEGLVGLSRGFMYAGVPRLIVSLWQVDDAATAEFMTRFYRLLLKENLAPAAALQQTQREMRTETEWQHPFYWAAFIFQGDWQ
ncbi:Tetratricopeptide TPR_1 repeat-containing protein [[Leptolyngbya] sp. PCC 7376]|uniref:CHAT domain-containing protein n=1 Tax=[Leptolyngbya] sp. PCC 7376 TaxID=111781 RepID=UPI00029ED869|nr:CHAT domain-containing tetratricopeptide repeat protein [[Leptolyngbya] sp. PCC 7376]AFY37287.1 Tetratricopeptide TPR_1 repeat-containing protein [[Leptolyngbya] sp. PCC 7376]